MNDRLKANFDLLIYRTDPETGRVGSIDGVLETDTGEYIGLYSGKTLAELTAEYGMGVTVGTVDEYRNLHDASYRTRPVPTCAEVYQEMLEILPPVNWVTVGGVESFRMSERLTGAITAIYARLGGTYWTFYDRIDLPPAEVAAKVRAAYLEREV